MKTRECIDVDSKKVSYLINRSSSQDIPVVFIHGLGSAASDYEEAFLRPVLSERIMIAPDLIGFGESDKPKDFSYDLLDQVKILDSLLEKLNYPCVDLVAHSMGGVIGILLGVQFGSRIRRLIVAEPNLVPENAQISQRICSYGSLEEFSKHFDTFIGKYNRPNNSSSYRFYNTLSQTTPEAIFKSACSLLEYAKGDMYKNFLQLDIPREYIKAEKSWQIISEQQLFEFSDRNIGFHVVPEAGHGMMGDNPKDFYDILEGILESPLTLKRFDDEGMNI